MKKKILLIISLIIFISPLNVHAISASVKCSAPSSVTVGQTFNVTISGSADSSTYWNGGVLNSSSNLRSNSGTGTYVEQNATSSISKTYSFTALSEGTATVSQTVTVSDENYNEKSFTSNTCTISIVKPAPATQNTSSSNNTKSKNTTTTTQSNKSSDNSLKSLSIDGFKISPEFNSDTLEYSVDLSNDTKKIKIVVEKNDEKATVSGDGEVEVKEGQNTFQILVTAENGDSKTYTISANVQEGEALTTSIDGKKYTILKKLIGIDVPTGFEKQNIEIDKTEVESFYSKKLNYSLVALKDNIGNISLFVYDSDLGKYTKYSPLVSDKTTIIVLSIDDSDIPHNYFKSKFTYNNDEIVGYAIDEKSDFRLVYGIDAETGEKGFYLYDMKKSTIQRFYNDQVVLYENLIHKLKIAFLILGGLILFLTIVIIILLSKNSKFKKMYLDRRLSKIDNPAHNDIKYQELDGTKTMTAIELNSDKKKKKKKEKTFLDE